MNDEAIDLVRRWQLGDQRAADELFRRYADRLVALARSHLAAKVSSRVDPEDVVQSVCRSFFVGARAGRFQLERGGDLWRLLAAITLHKLRDQVDRHTAARRSVASEQHFGGEDSLCTLQPQALAREPEPALAAALADEVERLMRTLRPHERRVVELRLQGYTLYEIADQTARSFTAVQRILDRLKQRLSPEPTRGAS